MKSEVKYEVIMVEIGAIIKIQKVSLIDIRVSRSRDTLDQGLKCAEFIVKCFQVGCLYGCA
jgi:hypothetical protein